MSAQAINLLLGTGFLYAKRSTDPDGKYKLIGSVKGGCEFHYKPAFAEQRPSDTLTYIRRDKVEEKAQMKVTLVDFRMDQLRHLLGLSISTSTLSRTISVRLAQELTTPASTTTSKSLSRTAKSTTSVQFSTLDRATDYVRGTDFTMVSTHKYKPISAAFKNKAVRAYYTALLHGSGIQRIDVGDKTTLQNISLMFVHRQSNGKSLAIQFPLATIASDLAMSFKEKEYTTPEVTFEALGDPTQLRGKKLFSIVRES